MSKNDNEERYASSAPINSPAVTPREKRDIDKVPSSSERKKTSSKTEVLKNCKGLQYFQISIFDEEIPKSKVQGSSDDKITTPDAPSDSNEANFVPECGVFPMDDVDELLTGQSVDDIIF